VNAPEAGTIKEFLASEEDTVTVGQDLVRIELGGAPPASESGDKPAPKDEPPTPQKSESEPASPAPPKETEQKTEQKPTEKPAEPKAKPQPAQSGSSAESGLSPVPAGRDERRVSTERRL
jgi:2-oxoglutarate dehydrogenase E2 component (dihydrolipoamide succinyltransferase)